MRIDSGHTAVAALAKKWNSTRSDDSSWKRRKSHDLRRKLMLGIVEPQLKRFEGELVLLYHTFLTMRPSGVHSFAHGSEMASHTVYWVTIGRIDGTKLRRTRARTRVARTKLYSLQFAIAPMFFVPLRSASVSLVPRYAPDAHEPHFVIREKKPDEKTIEPSFELDISALSDHLFALRRGKHDWYTKIEVVLGTKSTHAWLREHGSEETYQALKKCL